MTLFTSLYNVPKTCVFGIVEFKVDFFMYQGQNNVPKLVPKQNVPKYTPIYVSGTDSKE
jgi:hypothetical protein